MGSAEGRLGTVTRLMGLRSSAWRAASGSGGRSATCPGTTGERGES